MVNFSVRKKFHTWPNLNLQSSAKVKLTRQTDTSTLGPQKQNSPFGAPIKYAEVLYPKLKSALLSIFIPFPLDLLEVSE